MISRLWTGHAEAMYNVGAGIPIPAPISLAARETRLKRLFPLTILAALLTGCAGGLVSSRVEKGIRNSLPEYIGPAKRYSVHTDGSEASMLSGKIGRIEIEGEEVQVDPNLVVRRLYVDMREVRCDVDTRALKTVGSTTIQALIAEDAVNRYIERTREDLNLTVALEPGKILVKFVPSVAGVGVPISVAGTVAVAGTDKVNFVADSAALGRIPVPAYVVNKVLDRMNPVLDMSQMRFPVILKEIVLRKGAAEVKGSAKFKPAD